jgi:hypothetical protein
MKVLPMKETLALRCDATEGVRAHFRREHAIGVVVASVFLAQTLLREKHDFEWQIAEGRDLLLHHGRYVAPLAHRHRSPVAKGFVGALLFLGENVLHRDALHLRDGVEDHSLVFRVLLEKVIHLLDVLPFFDLRHLETFDFSDRVGAAVAKVEKEQGGGERAGERRLAGA